MDFRILKFILTVLVILIQVISGLKSNGQDSPQPEPGNDLSSSDGITYDYQQGDAQVSKALLDETSFPEKPHEPKLDLSPSSSGFQGWTPSPPSQPQPPFWPGFQPGNQLESFPPPPPFFWNNGPFYPPPPPPFWNNGPPPPMFWFPSPPLPPPSPPPFWLDNASVTGGPDSGQGQLPSPNPSPPPPVVNVETSPPPPPFWNNGPPPPMFWGPPPPPPMFWFPSPPLPTSPPPPFWLDNPSVSGGPGSGQLPSPNPSPPPPVVNVETSPPPDDGKWTCPCPSTSPQGPTIMTSETYKLTSHGLGSDAEAIRKLLAAAGVEYEDIHDSSESIGFGAHPILEIQSNNEFPSSKRLSSSQVIARYLGTKYNFMAHDPWIEAFHEQGVQVLDDLVQTYENFLKNGPPKTDSDVMTVMTKIKKETFPEGLTQLESLMGEISIEKSKLESSEPKFHWSHFLIGNWLKIWSTTGIYYDGMGLDLELSEVDLAQKFPNLTEIYKTIHEIPMSEPIMNFT